MRILDLAITATLIVAGIDVALPTLNTSPQCAPDEACYPIDPNPPKTVVPPNCFLDEEGGLVCYPVDESDKRRS